MQKSIFTYFEASFAVLVWGASFIATKIAVGQISPIAVVWLRFATGIPFLFVAVLLRKQFEFPKTKDLLYFAMLGFLGISFHQWLQSNGLRTSEATTTAWIVSTSPVFIAVLGWLALKEELNGIQIFGVALSMLGVVAVVSKGDLTSIAVKGTFGDLLIFISAINWAVFSILSRKGLKVHSSTLQTFWVMLVGWLIISVAFVAEKDYLEIPKLDMYGWIAMIFLGVFTTGLTYIAWFDVLAQLPAAQSGAFLFIEPLVSTITAAIILKEIITPVTVMGGAIILLGVWLVNRR